MYIVMYMVMYIVGVGFSRLYGVMVIVMTFDVVHVFCIGHLGKKMVDKIPQEKQSIQSGAARPNWKSSLVLRRACP